MKLLFLSFSLFITSTLKNVSAGEADNLLNFTNPNFGFTLDSGTPQYNFTQSPFKSDVVDCQTNKNTINFGPAFRNLSYTLGGIGTISACTSIKTEAPERFSTDNCKLITECSTSKLSRDRTSITTYFAIPKMLAEDYAMMQLQDNVRDMEKIEALRKFADKKYGKDFVPACKSLFNYDYKNNNKDSCDHGIMDAAFVRSQKKCSVVSVSCYSGGEDLKDYPTFLNTFKPANNDESPVQNFFAAKTDNTVNDSLTSDNEMLDALAGVMGSKGKTEDKIQEVFSKLFELKKQGRLDPVFNFGNDSITDQSASYKKSAHYQFFAKALAKPMDMAQARSLIEKYRRDFANEKLSKSCETTSSYMDICTVATEIFKSKRVHVVDRKGSALKLKNDDDEDRYEQLKSIYPNGIRDMKDFGIIMDANRCRAFDFLSKVDDMAVKMNDALNNNYGLNNPFMASTLNGLGGTSLYANQFSEFANVYKGPSDDNVIKSNSPMFSMPDTVAQKSLGGSGSTDIKVSGNDSDLANSLGSGLKETAAMVAPPVGNTTAGNVSYASPNSFTNYANGTEEEKNSASADSAKKSLSSTASANTALTDRIAELSKKLATSEDNLARIQEEKIEADKEKEHQRKADEENKSIADLKSQLNDLKTQSAKTGSATSLAQAPTATESADSSSSSRAPASAGETNDNGLFANASASKAAPQDNSSQNMAHSSGFSGGSEALASGARSVSAGGSGPSSLLTAVSSGAGIVLTKSDTVSDDAIQDKILELNNGQHFFIQEGDMVQEILPVLKNGKILLNSDGKPQFVRGKAVKAKDQKLAKITRDERKPASIDDAADLKRQEEENVKREHERAEYLKLKKLTNGILDNK